MSTAEDTFETLSGDQTDAREARNGLRHTASLTFTKIADGLINPKLVLTWLAGALGVPAAMIGLLVPIREAGALLPQILLAGWVERMRYRKWAWVVGSLGQGLCAALIVVIGLTLSGMAAGIALCVALGALALFRAACSVSFKDILGKTVKKTRRGSVTGFAGSAASLAVLVFAGLLVSGLAQNKPVILVAIGLAAVLWIGAAGLFSRLEEKASEPADDSGGLDLTPLREDKTLRRFIAVRGLLVPTSLAPPYFVLLASDAGQPALTALGGLLLASAGASFLASYVWGRLSDWSSRRVMQISGALGGVAMLGAIGLAQAGFAQAYWAMPAALFVLMVAYHGVRQGRSTYLVDMSPEDRRSTYAALANTVIGTLLLIVGALGGAAALLGPVAALAVFAVLSFGAALAAIWLPEVETKG